MMLCLFVFYNDLKCTNCGHSSRAWYAKYCKEGFKHCEIYCYKGKSWVHFDSKGRSQNHEILADSVTTITDMLSEDKNVSHMVGIEVAKKKCRRWFGLKIDLCNEDAARIAGIDIGMTFSPYQLYKKLVISTNKNFYVNFIWSRYGWEQQGNGAGRQTTSTADRHAECSDSGKESSDHFSTNRVS